MTTDLWMLVATGFWSSLIPLIYAPGRFQARDGFGWSFGNRDTQLDVAPWVARAVRAHHNHTENIALFAILVLCAHVTGKANEASAIGSIMFFTGRVAHTLIYTAGITYLRTVAFFFAALGEIIILVQLLK